MTVKLDSGKGRAPLWTIIALAVTIILAIVGWVRASEREKSNAEHRILENKIDVVTEGAKDREQRLRTVEQAVITFSEGMKEMAKSQERIEKKIGF
jgi:hypothetical protein